MSLTTIIACISCVSIEVYHKTQLIIFKGKLLVTAKNLFIYLENQVITNSSFTNENNSKINVCISLQFFYLLI